MAASGRATDGPVVNGDRASAIEGAVVVDDAFLQRGGHHHRLEGGPGLIGQPHVLIGPLLELGVTQCLGVLLLADGGVVFQLLQLGRLGGVHNAVGVVEVIVRRAGHGQHRPGVRFHHQAEAAVGDIKLLNALLQRLLCVHLDGGVNGGVDVVAVHRVGIAGVSRRHLRSRGVFGGDDLPVLARQVQVVQGLQAIRALVGLVDKADDLGGHGGVGIVSFGVGGQVEASLQIVLVNKGADLVGHVVLHLFRQHLVGRLGLLQPGHDILPVQAQNLGHLVGDEIIGGLHLGLLLRLYGGFGAGIAKLVLFVHLHRGQHVPGREDDILHRAADGQDIPVGIVDGAPVGRGGNLPGLLGDGLILQLLMLHHLELPELAKEDAKGEDPKNAAEHQDPLHALPLQPAPGMGGAALVCCLSSQSHCSVPPAFCFGRWQYEGVRNRFLTPSCFLS